MTTEVEWGTAVDRPGQALEIIACASEEAARELAEAFQAIELMAYAVRREVTYTTWQEQP